MKIISIIHFSTLALLAACCPHLALAAAPPAPFADAPAAWRPFLLKARAADALTDPLQRCLAFPDMPGNQWPAGLAADYCHLLFDPEISLKEVAAYLDRGAVAELEAFYRNALARHFSTTDFSEKIHGDLDVFALSPEGDALSQRWLALAPDSAFANAARGLWLKNQAWEARGPKWIRDTPIDQQRKMIAIGREAVALFEKSLRLEPKLLPAHAALMDLARSTGDELLAGSAFAQATRVDPACRVTTKYRMLSLLPRWGGSYQAMDAYATELAQYFARRPLVALTAVLPLDDRGDVLFRAGKYAQAVVALSPGAALTPYPDLFEKLGRSMAQQSGVDDWKVLATLLSAYRYGEGDPFVVNERGRMLNWAGDFEWSLKSLKGVLALQPDNANTNLLYGTALHELGREGESEPYLLKAIDDPVLRPYALNQLAWAMLRSGQLEKADRHAASSVESSPDVAEGWLVRANIKSARGDMAAARVAAQRFLRLAGKGADGDPAVEWAQGLVRASEPGAAPVRH